MRLSILIPSLPERSEKLASLCRDVLAPQIRASGGEAEVLVLTDFRTMSLGEKRNKLMSIADGEYFVHLDDDDSLAPGAVGEILRAVRENPGVDVVCYDSMASIDGCRPFRVSTSIEFDNEQVSPDGEGGFLPVRRKPWHWCCWRAELARRFRFSGRIDEDWQWLSQVLPHVRTQARLDLALHVYRHDTRDSFCLEAERE